MEYRPVPKLAKVVISGTGTKLTKVATSGTVPKLASAKKRRKNGNTNIRNKKICN